MKYHNPVAKAKINSASLRLSVNAHCYMCMGGSKTDLKTLNSIVSDIRGCTSHICPLLTVRPFTPSKQTGNSDAQVEVKT